MEESQFFCINCNNRFDTGRFKPYFSTCGHDICEVCKQNESEIVCKRCEIRIHPGNLVLNMLGMICLDRLQKVAERDGSIVPRPAAVLPPPVVEEQPLHPPSYDAVTEEELVNSTESPQLAVERQPFSDLGAPLPSNLAPTRKESVKYSEKWSPLLSNINNGTRFTGSGFSDPPNSRRALNDNKERAREPLIRRGPPSRLASSGILRRSSNNVSFLDDDRRSLHSNNESSRRRNAASSRLRSSSQNRRGFNNNLNENRSNRIYITNLPSRLFNNTEELISMFSLCGEIDTDSVEIEKYDNGRRCYAFLTFINHQSLKLATIAFHKRFLDYQEINVFPDDNCSYGSVINNIGKKWDEHSLKQEMERQYPGEIRSVKIVSSRAFVNFTTHETRMEFVNPKRGIDFKESIRTRREQPTSDMDYPIHISNVPKTINEVDLQTMFTLFGLGQRRPYVKDIGKYLTYAYVNLASEYAVDLVIKHFRRAKPHGWPCWIQISEWGERNNDSQFVFQVTVENFRLGTKDTELQQLFAWECGACLVKVRGVSALVSFAEQKEMDTALQKARSGQLEIGGRALRITRR